MAKVPLFKTNPYYFPGLADFSQPSFWIAAAAIIFNPVFWNLVARNEYQRKTITKLLGNRPYWGCYALGFTIFTLGIVRDQLYNVALSKQPAHALLLLPAVKFLGGALFLAGNTLVLTSFYKLGITGTYLGDYFGILMSGIVTSFPFNVVADPMYVGSTLSFIGYALWNGKPAGLLLSVLVFTAYQVATRFEGPFTAKIYAAAAKKKKTASRRSSTASTAKRSGSVSRRNSTASKKETPSKKKTDTPSKKKETATPNDTPAKRGRKKKAA